MPRTVALYSLELCINMLNRIAETSFFFSDDPVRDEWQRGAQVTKIHAAIHNLSTIKLYLEGK